MNGLAFENKAELHKHFSTHCFNETWKLIDKENRSDEEYEEMVHYAIASLFHWSKREDCTNRQKSIGCWQVSHCYVLAEDFKQAAPLDKLCLEFSENEESFYLSYAHETLARTAALAGKKKKIKKNCQKPDQKIKDKDEKELILADLITIT